jgi:hypothetical protein
VRRPRLSDGGGPPAATPVLLRIGPTAANPTANNRCPNTRGRPCRPVPAD